MLEVGQTFKLIYCVSSRRDQCMFRQVKFMKASEEGTGNLSAVQMMENGQIDFFSHPESINYALNYSAIEATKTSYVSSYQVAQFLNTSSNDYLDFTSFLVHNIRFVVIILIGYLSIVATVFALPNLIRPNYDRPSSLKLVGFHIFFLDANRLPRFSAKLAIICLAFQLFLFFDLFFLTGTIKVSKELGGAIN